MTEERYQHLLGRLLDDELNGVEAAELSVELRANSQRRRDARQQLALWDLFSQSQAPERAAAAFESAWRIRLQAEGDASRFVRLTARQIRSEESGESSDSKKTSLKSAAPAGSSILFPASTKRTINRAALALAACFALLLGLVRSQFSPTMEEPVLAEARGQAVAIQRGTEWIRATAGLALRPGDVLSTGINGVAVIGFGNEQTKLRVAEKTELTFAAFKSAKRLALKTGTLEADVARQPAFRPLVVTTPNAAATVIGTRFTLQASAAHTRLDVAEGKVRFADTTRPAVKPVTVAAGHSAEVAAGTELAALPRTGGILAEYWTNVPGAYHVNFLKLDPRYPDQPSVRTKIESFEAPLNRGENFGARFRGYIHPPVTGQYTFWLAAWEGAELYVSRNDRPEGVVQIAFAEKTGPREWNKHAGQKSSTLTLIAGRRYYLEALQKQSAGADHLAVAWQPPGRDREVISGEALSPFQFGQLMR